MSKIEDLKLSEKAIKRFWDKIDVKSPDECWEWTSFRLEGYGRYIMPSRKSIVAHRLSLLLATGGGDGCALHSCDNRACCNPKHLRWGTPADNMRDMYERNHAVRIKRAENNRRISASRRKLSDSQLDYIRQLVSAGYSQDQCAKWYCVSQVCVSNALRTRKVIA